MKKIRTVGIAVVFTSVLALTSCGEGQQDNEDTKMKVYTSFSAMSAITKPLIGNDDILIQLTNGNIEPHDYEPTAKDIVEISNADMFIYNGVGFEHYINEVEASVDSNVFFVNSSQNISFTSKNDKGIDSHVWLNLDNVKIQANNIAHGLIAKDETNEKIYVDNLKAFVSYVDTLKAGYDTTLTNYDDTVVVLHPAYAYIFEPYGIKQLAIQQNHDVEPTITELKEVIDFINDNNIKYVFAATVENSKSLETVVNETGVEVLILNSMENINEEDIDNNTYIDIMTENLEALKKYKK